MRLLANITRAWAPWAVAVGIFAAACSLWAQSPTRGDLEGRLADIGDRVANLTQDQDALLRRSRSLANRIDDAKRDLPENGDPRSDRDLQRDLRAAQALADQLETLDVERHALTQEGVTVRQAVMLALDAEIDAIVARSDAAETTEARERILAEAIALQAERDAHATALRAQSRELLLGLDVALEDTDGPDQIAQKIGVVRDQLDIVDDRIAALSDDIRSAKEKFGLLRGMWELLQELRRGEEDELDLDRDLRAAEIEGDMSVLEDRVLVLRARMQRRRGAIAPLRAKVTRFQEEAAAMLMP
ncbi:hypothetical protein HOK31_22005, partial [Candidatus Poribacteria bacterium]|nr:hypothetical protein [Candidatus Poribacteria bacterium]